MDNSVKELNRQCEMAWKRGYDYGFVKGVVAVSITSCVILLIVALFN